MPSRTADEFLNAAAGLGLQRSLPWIRTLIRDGLLDQPDKHGIEGRRGGRTEATWPESQFQLFLALLDQMSKGVKGTATLCNIPVGFWLYLGPAYVPVRQVRRALHTYGGTHRTTSKRAARDTARRIAEHFAGGPDMTRRDREQLIKATVDAASNGSLDRDALITAARTIFDPEHTGRTVGPPGAPLSPEAWVRSIEAHLTALSRLDDFEAGDFEDARLAHQELIASYAERQPEFARDRNVGALHKPVTLEFLFQNACLHTLANLGFQRIARERHDASNPAWRPASNLSPHAIVPDKSPPRPRERPGGMAHGKATSACKPSVTPPRRAASS